MQNPCVCVYDMLDTIPHAKQWVTQISGTRFYNVVEGQSIAAVVKLRKPMPVLELKHFHDGDDVRPHYLKWADLLAYVLEMFKLPLPPQEFLLGRLPENLSWIEINVFLLQSTVTAYGIVRHFAAHHFISHFFTDPKVWRQISIYIYQGLAWLKECVSDFSVTQSCIHTFAHTTAYLPIHIHTIYIYKYI